MALLIIKVADPCSRLKSLERGLTGVWYHRKPPIFHILIVLISERNQCENMTGDYQSNMNIFPIRIFFPPNIN